MIVVRPKAGVVLDGTSLNEVALIWRHVGGFRFVYDLAGIDPDTGAKAGFVNGFNGLDVMLSTQTGKWAVGNCPSELADQIEAKQGSFLAFAGARFESVDEAEAAVKS